MTATRTTNRRRATGLASALGMCIALLMATAGGAAADSVVARKPPPRTTDVHVLAYNDFHGNLDPTTLNIYGQFAGGAAWLARAIEDKQALYGDHALTVMAGDNIGASPLVDGLFFGEP